MDNNNVKAPAGARKKKKVKGRGRGTGHGCTAGRGTKGQRSRAGGRVRLGFEGGQMPLYRQIARRGFSNYPFKKEFSIVNVDDLNRFADETNITKTLLIENGMVKKKKRPIKILGRGTLEKKLTVEVDRVSSAAREKIIKLGGTVIEKGETAEQVKDQ